MLTRRPEFALAIATLVLFGLLFHWLGAVLTPFLLGAVLAYILDPLVDRLERLKFSRTLGTALVLALGVLVVAGVALLLIPVLAEQAAQIAQRVPRYMAWAQDTVVPWLEGLGIPLDHDSLKRLAVQQADTAKQAATTVLPWLGGQLGSLLALLANLLIVPVVTFYLLRDWDAMVNRIDALIPRRWHAATVTLAREIDAVLAEFLRGQLTVMLVMGGFYAAGLSLAGLDFALPIGLLAGLLGFIPYLGAALGLLLASLEAVLQFQSVAGVLPVVGVFVVGQALEGMLITPWLVGDRVGLHPVGVILALAAFGQLFGFFGILLAVPLAAVLLVALRHLRAAYLASPLYGHGYNQAPMNPPPMHEANIPSLTRISRGKVRDIYALDERHLLLVTTDRLSAFDVVLPTPIADKGRVLTATSEFWFHKLAHIVPNQLTGISPESVVKAEERDQVAGRALVVKRLQPLPVEAIVRGYLVGSGWKDYQATGAVCGIPLPGGLKLADRLPEPIFTPSTKAELGTHDENISFEQVSATIGAELAARVRDVSLALYAEAAKYALTRGIIIADTKFEFGLDEHGVLHWIDEALTPDSSRFWPLDSYQPGSNPPSFDKQYVRDWLEASGWNKTPPAPALPEDVAAQTTAKYREALARLTAA
jgi:phosphoribosylaminoimidazole-succinocarboxamide synthase